MRRPKKTIKIPSKPALIAEAFPDLKRVVNLVSDTEQTETSYYAYRKPRGKLQVIFDNTNGSAKHPYWRWVVHVKGGQGYSGATRDFHSALKAALQTRQTYSL